jgi:hypothetical protein
VQDRDSSGEKIYSGYVSGITSYINGDEQGITLDVLGYVSRLGMTLDWDGTNISMVRNSQTPGEIAKDVIDKYRARVAEERINYGTATVDIAGTDISYTSNAKSCLETIERARQMAGSTWYWYVDAENVFYFDEYPTTPTHLFVFGKDVSSIEINRNVDSLKNEFIFWNGLQPDDTHFLSTRYYHTSSISSYWNRFENLTDGRITDDATADEFAENETHYYLPLSGYKNLGVVSDVKVLSNYLTRTGMFTDTIYGVRKSDIEWVKTQKNWVNLDEHIKDKLTKTDLSNVMGLVKQAIDYSDLYRYNAEKHVVNPASPYIKLYNEFKDVRAIDETKRGTLLWLCNAYGVNTKTIVDPKDLIAKYKEEVNAVNKRYPLLEHVTRYSVEAEDVAEYINLIDSAKGV